MGKLKKSGVFISYSFNHDLAYLEILSDRLKRSRFFEPVIVDRTTDTDVDLGDRIVNKLLKCDFFIPIFSIDSYKMQWINQETGYARSLQDQNKIKIITLIENKVLDQIGEDKYKGFIHEGRYSIRFNVNAVSFEKAIDEIMATLNAERRKDSNDNTIIDKVSLSISRSAINVNPHYDSRIHLKLMLNLSLRNLTAEILSIASIKLIIWIKDIDFDRSIYDKDCFQFELISYRNKPDEKKEIKYSWIVINPKDLLRINTEWKSKEMFHGNTNSVIALIKSIRNKVERVSAILRFDDNSTSEVLVNLVDN